MKKSDASQSQSASEIISSRIAELGDWRGKILSRMRTLIKQADPDVVEEWKWAKASSPGVPVWSHDGIICTGESYKSIVKLTFAKGASLKDPARLFNSSLDGNTRRAIDIHEGEEVDASAFKALIRQAVALNSAGKSKPSKKAKGPATAVGLALVATMSVALLGAQAPAVNPRGQWTQPPEAFARRVVATGLESPWEVTWGPDGFLWVTERVGKRIVRINPTDGSLVVAATIDEVHQSLAQDGLLGMALHPRLLAGTSENYVYVMYTYDADPGPQLSRRGKIRRYTYDPATQHLGSPIDVIRNLPHGTDHGGGRLLVGPDLKLYVSRGDHGANFGANYCLRNRAQDLPTTAEIQTGNWDAYQGKVLRINLDGSIPSDNPLLAGVRSHVYSYGHRNPQGMAFDAGGRLYASEHGQDTDDEVNLVEAGRNYGWPLVAGFKDGQYYAFANWSASSPGPCAALMYGRTVPASVPVFEESTANLPNFAPPLKTFFTVPTKYDRNGLGNATVAPSGIDLYTSPAIPGWQNSLLMTAMTSGVVFRMPLTRPGQLGTPLTYFKANDRYRDLAISPDGRRIFVITDNEGRTSSDTGALTTDLEHPGALLEFVYSGARAGSAR